MKPMPKIHTYMTAAPHTIGADIPLKAAQEIMRAGHIRHLPVLSGGKLVGVITDRDVKLASRFEDAETILVDDVMTPDPFVIDPGASLDEVVEEMAEHKYGCAIIRKDERTVVGIFTYIDAMKTLAEILRVNYKRGPA